MLHSQPKDQKDQETRHDSLFATRQVEHAIEDKSKHGGRKARCL
jgi:hypothetical protein